MTDHDRQFVSEFEACRRPLDYWHHRDHIKLAYLYLCQYPFDEALAKLRVGIKAHNATHNITEAITSGYHETMTQAWLRLVHLVICEYGQEEDADAFYEAHPELSQTKTLRLFYSRERIVSAEAKATFVEPDLTPLPRSMRSS